MLKCCIRSEPRLEKDESTSTHIANDISHYMTRKVESPVLTHDEIPAHMIDLEAGLNFKPFTVYIPRAKPPSTWVHGARLAI